jgi:hypothetical protein
VGRALLAELGQALLQRLHAHRVGDLRPAKQLGSEVGMPVKAKRPPSVKVSPMRVVPWLGTPMTSSPVHY